MPKCNRYNKRSDSAFTLIELMFVLAIISILAIVSVPKYQAIKENYRLEGAAQTAISQLNYGKQQAMDTRETVYIIFQSDNVGVYREMSGILELTAPAIRYEGGVTFSAGNSAWMYEAHQNPVDSSSPIVGKAVRYNYRGFALDNGKIRLESSGGQTVCILVSEVTGRIRTVQCEENGDDDDYCNQDYEDLPDYPDWTAQDYPNSGTHVIYNGKIFYNKWYANDDDIPGEIGPWQEVTSQWRFYNTYEEGALVCFNGKMYQARYWSQNQTPGLLESPWQELTDQWRFFNVYYGGEIVWYNGKQYRANYYSQNQTPKDNDPYGPWVEV